MLTDCASCATGGGGVGGGGGGGGGGVGRVCVFGDSSTDRAQERRKALNCPRSRQVPRLRFSPSLIPQ